MSGGRASATYLKKVSSSHIELPLDWFLSIQQVKAGKGLFQPQKWQSIAFKWTPHI